MAEGVGVLVAGTFDEEVRGSELPVLVDVWTEWCPPCKAIAPVLEAIAAEHGDRLRVYKLNGDDSPELVSRFGIMSFPTLLVFRDGDVVKRLVGARSKKHLLEELDGVLR